MFARATAPAPSALLSTGRIDDATLASRLAAAAFVFFDFDGVFTDNRVAVDQTGVESVFCNRSDGLGLSKLRRAGVEAMIVSTERNPVVSVRAQKLKLPCEQAVEDKAEAVRRLAAAAGHPLERAIFVGNDVNDAPAMRLCGLALTVADAWPEAYAVAHAATRRKGGAGAVREICDVIVALRESEGGA